MTPEQLARLQQIVDVVKLQRAALESLRGEVPDEFRKDDLQGGADTLTVFVDDMEQCIQAAKEFA